MDRMHARRAAAIAGLGLALAAALTSCSSPSHTAPSAAHRPSLEASASSVGVQVRPTRRILYRVVAPVLQTRGMRAPLACQTILQSLPPAGCGGVEVRGFDFESLHGVQRGGGSWWTPQLLLVGTWNGRVLTLT